MAINGLFQPILKLSDLATNLLGSSQNKPRLGLLKEQSQLEPLLPPVLLEF